VPRRQQQERIGAMLLQQGMRLEQLFLFTGVSTAGHPYRSAAVRGAQDSPGAEEPGVHGQIEFHIADRARAIRRGADRFESLRVLSRLRRDGHVSE